MSYGSWIVGLAALAVAEASSAEEPAFEDTVSVFEVEVPVRVLSGKGSPVAGLESADFLLFDEGEAQEVLGFEVSRHGEAADSLFDDSGPSRNIVFLIDFAAVGLPPRGAGFLEELLEQPLAPGDRYGIAVHGVPGRQTTKGTGARVLVDLTDNADVLRSGAAVVRSLADHKPKKTEALIEALSRQVGGIPTESPTVSAATVALDLRSDPSTLSGAASLDGWLDGRYRPGPDPRRLPMREKPLRFALGGRESAVRFFAHAVADLVTILREVDGENHLVLVANQRLGSMEEVWMTARLQPMLAALRRNGWTLHVLWPKNGFAQDDIFYLANESGGELLENQTDIVGAFERLEQRLRITYRLTFRPSQIETDGKYRKIEVKLRDGRQGRRVRHRPGYFAPPPAEGEH